nr:MAG TPA: hypothetical protein [Caudoviricetes sp.]
MLSVTLKKTPESVPKIKEILTNRKKTDSPDGSQGLSIGVSGIEPQGLDLKLK